MVGKDLFDTVIDRRNTGSIKYDFPEKFGKPEGILPLWVADMDFPSPPCVARALDERVRHGIFGYSRGGEGDFTVLRQWYSKRFGWELQPQWLVRTPGVIFAVAAAIRALTEERDAVLIQQPVYYPFAETVRNNNRMLAVSRLLYQDGAYQMDFADFENQIVQSRAKLFILCSPHNPVGRVWTEDELLRVGKICMRHGIAVVSDEIHADFTYPGHRHLVFANLRPEFAESTITCTSPSKTFNLAGLQLSNILIPNEILRRKFRREIVKTGYGQPNVMALTAGKAAYADGEAWLEELKEYLKSNLDFLRGFLADHLPHIKLVEPEGTYLVWLDFRELGLTDEQLDDLMVRRAGVWLDPGPMFGAGGEGFQRINIACPRATLKRALIQMAQAVGTL